MLVFSSQGHFLGPPGRGITPAWFRPRRHSLALAPAAHTSTFGVVLSTRKARPPKHDNDFVGRNRKATQPDKARSSNPLAKSKTAEHSPAPGPCGGSQSVVNPEVLEPAPS